MLSSQYRLRLQTICDKIARHQQVNLDDMVWATKLAKANQSAGEMMRRARRVRNNPDMQEGGFDDFMNRMDLGDPDPSNYKKGFDNAEDIGDWFHQERSGDWRQHD